MVYGLGETGYSVIRFLQEQHGSVVATDSRLGRYSNQIPYLQTVRSEYPDVRIVPPRRIVQELAHSTRVVASPGIALDDVLIKYAHIEGVPVVGDLDLFLQEVSQPVIGITGTNGKSTVASLVGEMLRPQNFVVCGNIGLPVLDALGRCANGYVVELSSFQLERLSKGQFKVAAITNIAADHLDRHRSIEEYVASKQRIYEDCGFAVFNGRDRRTVPVTSFNGIAVNNDPNWQVVEDGIVVSGIKIPQEKIALEGRHNHFNLVMAAAIATQFEVDLATIRDVALNFTGLAHRTQLVAELAGVKFIDDSKATNVAATVSALHGLSNGNKELILIAGGEGKGADFLELADAVSQCAKTVVLIGQDAHRIGACIEDTPVEYANSMGDAVYRAQSHALSGDIVLLSPACASFDMFRNFEHRGSEFRRAVEALKP